MAKKLRDSAYVNDLVIYRNKCEDKKLKFTLAQLEYLKTIYSRQKEQEKMFFAVQHMAVPVRTDPVIMNLRKGLHLDRKARSQNSSALTQNQDDLSTFRSVSTHSRVAFDPQNTADVVPSSSKLLDGGDGRTSSSTTNKNTSRGKNGEPSSSGPSNGKNKDLRASRRVISPHPKRLNGPLPTDSRKNLIPGSTAAKSNPLSVPSSKSISPGLKTESVSRNGDNSNVDGAIGAREIQDGSSLGMHSRASRSTSIWNKSAKKNKYAPRLSDLPPVNINIYENPCTEKESKEKWQMLVNTMKNSSIEETRTEAELLKYNQDVRKKWMQTYSDIKKDRISAMVKDKMRMGKGQQLTLVKFLPKSRQTDFIKEAQLAQHKM